MKHQFPDLREPNALDALAYVAGWVARVGAGFLFVAAVCVWWILT